MLPAVDLAVATQQVSFRRICCTHLCYLVLWSLFLDEVLGPKQHLNAIWNKRNTHRDKKQCAWKPEGNVKFKLERWLANHGNPIWLPTYCSTYEQTMVLTFFNGPTWTCTHTHTQNKNQNKYYMKMIWSSNLVFIHEGLLYNNHSHSFTRCLCSFCFITAELSGCGRENLWQALS